MKRITNVSNIDEDKEQEEKLIKIYNILIFIAKQQINEYDKNLCFKMNYIKSFNLKNKKQIKEFIEDIRAIQSKKIENKFKIEKINIYNFYNLLGEVNFVDEIMIYSLPHSTVSNIQDEYIEEKKSLNNLRNKYARKLYLWALDNINYKNINVDLENLKKIFEIKNNQYERFNNFRDKVLEIAINEVNKNTNLNIYFTKILEDKKVIKINFKIILKRT